MVKENLVDSPIILNLSNDGTEVFATINKNYPNLMPLKIENFISAINEIGASEYEINYLAIDKLIFLQKQDNIPFLSIAKKLDAKVECQVSKDKLEASIIIKPPKGGRDVEIEDVYEALRNAGIKFGIKEDIIQNAVLQKWYDEKIIIAEGQLPQDGEDAKIEYFFETTPTKPTPKITEDGKVDFYELNIVENVTEGQALARKIPPVPGINGKTIFGEEIPCKEGRDIALPLGKNVKISPEDPNIVVSEINGQPRIINNKICVLPIYEVSGDVDFSTGNINFIGDVIVRGAVRGGFKIKAEGNISINGPVEGSTLEADGSIILTKGTHGQDKGLIIAGGDIIAKFLEHTTVKAGGNIKVSDAIIQSQVTALKSVIVEGKKGFIIGGTVSAGEEVKARVIGNYLATPTEIEAGCNPKLRFELREIEKRKDKLRLNLDRTEKGVNSLKQIQEKEGFLAPDKKDLLLHLTRAQFHLMGEIRKLEIREEELKEMIASSLKGRVIVNDVVYAGVKITIKDAILYVKDQIKAASFYEQDGEIHIGAYHR